MIGSMSITEAHVLAVLAGVLFGCAAISTSCWVWLRKQIFAFGGSALCGSGVVLLGLSIWHSVEFGVSGSGFSLKLQAELERKFQSIDEALQRNSVAIAGARKEALDAQTYAVTLARLIYKDAGPPLGGIPRVPNGGLDDLPR
jgi:hypothetical protein